MNHCNEEFIYDVEIPSEMTFQKTWLTDKDKLIQYCHYLYKNFNKFDYLYMYDEVQFEAIRTNNIMALEIFWQGVYNHDRDTPSYDYWVLIAAKHGNLKTFEHCLYAYMNNGVIDRVEDLDYQKLLSECVDPEVHQFLKELEPVIIDNVLPSNYSNCFDPAEIEIDEYFTEERINKYKLYNKIINQHIAAK